MACGQRVYVVGEKRLFRGSQRQAHSVTFNSEAVKQEDLLWRLRGYRLLNFAEGLYGLNPGSGHLLRFGSPNSGGEIEDAYTAASATGSGRSLIRAGLPVVIDNLLVVLDPGDLRPLRRLTLSGLTNVADFQMKTLKPANNRAEVPEDLVYNPQKDKWVACGQGLKLQPGAVAAFRGGKSERIWALQPNGEMHTLTEASPRLFTPDYVDKFPPKALPPALNGTKEIEIRNESQLAFQRKLYFPHYQFALEGFSSSGLATINPPDYQFDIERGAAKKFEISYHEGDPAAVKLRFLIYSTDFSACFLQVTLSGPELSNISSVFRYAASQWGHPLDLIDVPDTFIRHIDGRPIVIPQP
ncbi:MAG: hypothetical protein ACREAC_08780, partial [Blastocatellia bacterium]